MIQEKDFLYRVPVKTELITTPRGQIINPEILVDVEGGEFMHGNILDANSTNKLINQSVKDAVDNKLIESGLVTQGLLDAETSARTKGDEDLSAKIQAEQTRAEGKEKEISDKLAIVNGDSNTEGSFRKAIADVIAAAPEDLDTLKEIADKLAGNDGLHTALNQAITEKADASALLNEVTRATGVEGNLRDGINKVDQKVTANTTAIEGKQDKGDYMQYSSVNDNGYTIDKAIAINGDEITNSLKLYAGGMTADNGSTTDRSIVKYSSVGIKSSKYQNCLATSDGTFKPISDFVLKEEADKEYVTQNQLDDIKAGLGKKQDKIKVNSVDVSNLDRANIDQLIAIVKDLLIALDSSGLIMTESGVE